MVLTALLTMIFGCSETLKTPEWTKAKVIADNLDHPNAITIDDKNIYYITGGTIASLHEGTSGVWKIPLSGGQPVQIFKGYQKDEKIVILPDTFVAATDEKYVYYSTGYICRISKDGGEPEQITAGTPTEMVLDNDRIYWHNFVGEGMKSTPVYSVDKKGGEVKTLTDAVNISAIVVDKDFLYWSQPDGIYKTPKIGGEKTKIYSVTGDKNYIDGLIADNETFYFTQGNGRNSLMKVSKNGGEVTRFDTGYSSGVIAQSKTLVYFAGLDDIYNFPK